MNIFSQTCGFLGSFWRRYLVYPHQPVLGGVRLLQHVQLKVLVADFGVAHAVVARRPLCGKAEVSGWPQKSASPLWRWPRGLTGLGVDLAEAVVAHLVHEAVEQHRGALAVDAELARGGVVVVLLDVAAGVGAAANANHPQELVDVWGGKREGWG